MSTLDLEYHSNPVSSFCVDCLTPVPVVVQLICKQNPTHQSVRPNNPVKTWRDISKPFSGVCFTCDQLNQPATNKGSSTPTVPKRSMSFGFGSSSASLANANANGTNFQRELTSQLLCSLCKRVLATHDQIEALCRDQLKTRKTSRSSRGSYAQDDTLSILPEPMAPSLSDVNAERLKQLEDIYGSVFTSDVIRKTLEKCKYDTFHASAMLSEMQEMNQAKLPPKISVVVNKEDRIRSQMDEWKEQLSSWVICYGYDGKEYYVNRSTNETVWALPEDLNRISMQSDEWTDVKASDGRTYFVHKTNQQTTWEKPIVLNEALAADEALKKYEAENLPSPAETESSHGYVTPPTTPASAALVSKKRFEVFFELAESEKKYIDYLDVMCEVFFEPLRRSIADGTLDPVLFSPLEKLLENIHSTLKPLNKQLLLDFETAISPWDDMKPVCAMFTRNAPLLKLYSTYVINFPIVMSSISELSNVEAFRLLLDNAVHNSKCEGKTLSSFLIMPIQRVPRYSLFLKSLLDVTPTAHPDYHEIVNGIKNIDKVTQSLNEAKRDHEGRERVLSMQENFMKNAERSLKTFNMVSPGRVLVTEGKIIQRVDFRSGRTRYFFLFNDILVVAKMISENPVDVHYKDMMFLSDIINVTEAANDEKSFSLVRKTNAEYGIPNGTFVFIAADAADRSKWTKAIRDRLQPRSSLSSLTPVAGSIPVSEPHNMDDQASVIALESVNGDAASTSQERKSRLKFSLSSGNLKNRLRKNSTS